MKNFDSLTSLSENGRWRQQQYPVPIVVALICHEDDDGPQFLLIQRNSNSYGGQWALVGGKWDFGETLATAVTREVNEETSLETRFVALRGLLSERVQPQTAEMQAAHFLLLVCELEVINGEAQEQTEGAVGWFSMAEIDVMHQAEEIIPSDYAMLKQFATQSGDSIHFEVEMIAAIGSQSDTPSHIVSFEQENGRYSDSDTTL